MNVFPALRDRFLFSTKSSIERSPIDFAHVAISDGESNQIYRLPDKHITFATEDIYVGDECWEIVPDLDDHGPFDKVCELLAFEYSAGISVGNPIVRFGDGDHHGMIPGIDMQIRASYEKCTRTISDRELCVIFHNAIFSVNKDFKDGIQVTTFDYSTGVLNLDDDMGENAIDHILCRARVDYEIARLNSGDSIYLKSQSMVLDGKAISKMQKEIFESILRMYKDTVASEKKSKQKALFIHFVSSLDAGVL